MEYATLLWDEIVPGVISLIGTALLYLSWQFKQLLDAKIHDARFHCATGRMNDGVSHIVRKLEQTVKPALKKARADGRLTKEDAGELLETAWAELRDDWGDRGLRELQKCFGLTEEGVKNKAMRRIESEIHDMKNGHGPVFTPPKP